MPPKKQSALSSHSTTQPSSSKNKEEADRTSTNAKDIPTTREVGEQKGDQKEDQKERDHIDERKTKTSKKKLQSQTEQLGEKKRKGSIFRSLVNRPSLSSQPLSDPTVLQLKKDGLWGEVPWKSKTSTDKDDDTLFAIYHEIKGNKMSAASHARFEGVGCQSIPMTLFRALGKVGELSSEKYRVVHVDGIATEAHLVSIQAQFEGKVHAGDMVTLSIIVATQQCSLRCYVESVDSNHRSFKGYVLGGSSDLTNASPSGTIFLRPTLEFTTRGDDEQNSAEAEAEAEAGSIIDIATDNVVSVAPFSFRLLGPTTSNRHQWYQQTEGRTVEAVCDWSKAIMIVALIDGSARSHSIHARAEYEILILAPHAFSATKNRMLLKYHASKYTCIFRKMFQMLRPSALVDPRRTVQYPSETAHTFSDRPDLCSMTQGTVHHLAGGCAQEPTPKLFASISLKDIQIQGLQELIDQVKKRRNSTFGLGLAGSDSSPWEARLKFSIEVAELPTFDSKVQETIEKSAVVGDSAYGNEHRKAFAYSRHEKIDPRIQNTHTRAIQKSFSIVKHYFEGDSHTHMNNHANSRKKNKDKSAKRTPAAAAASAAVLLKLISTDPWDSNPDKFPTVGPDFISWKISEQNEMPLNSLESVLQLYVRRSSAAVPNNLEAVISTSFLRVELKIRDTRVRSKQYVAGSLKIPLTKFVHKRWMTFNLDQKRTHDDTDTMDKDVAEYMKESVLQIAAATNIKKKWKWQSDSQRIQRELKSFQNDPLRSVMTISGNRSHVKLIAKKAKNLIPGSKIYGGNGIVFDDDGDGDGDGDGSDDDDDDDDTNITVWIEKELLRHEFSFPLPTTIFLRPTTSMMNTKLDSSDWQNCSAPIMGADSVENKQTLRSSSRRWMPSLGGEKIAASEIEGQVVNLTFLACLTVCDIIDITHVGADPADKITAHSVDGQRHRVTHGTSSSNTKSLGVSSEMELIYLKHSQAQSYISITKKDVHIHSHQPGIISTHSTSKVDLRSLHSWKRCHPFEEESKQEIDHARRALIGDHSICELCLYRRGIPLNASTSEKVAAINTGAHLATRLCLHLEANKRSQWKRMKGIIKRVQKSGRTADITFFTDEGEENKTTHYHVPLSQVQKICDEKMEEYKKGDSVKFLGIPEVVTNIKHGKGYLCSTCFHDSVDPENSSWVELPPNNLDSSSSTAVITIDFTEVRDGDNKLSKDTVESINQIEFGRHPLDRLSLKSDSNKVGRNVKHALGLNPEGTEDLPAPLLEQLPEQLPEQLHDTSKTLTLVVKRTSFHQTRTHSTTMASAWMKTEQFDTTGLSPDINMVSKIIQLSTKVAAVLEDRQGTDKFQEACRFLEYRATDFTLYCASKFDYRGTLKRALAPLRGLLAMILMMVLDSTKVQEEIILKSIFGSNKLRENTNARFWNCCGEIISNYTALFFGDLRREKLLCSSAKRIGHTTTRINDSSIVIIGGSESFIEPDRLLPEEYAPVDHPDILRSPGRLPGQGVLAFDSKTKAFSTPDIGRLQVSTILDSTTDEGSSDNQTTLSRLDHTTVNFHGSLIVFGGHYGASHGMNGELIPGKALCDLHLLDTLTIPWTWHQLRHDDPHRPKKGRYGHTSIVTKILVGGLEQDVMVTFGGMQSPHNYMNNMFMNEETYSILCLDEEIESIRWLASDPAQLVNNRWRTKDLWIGNLELNFSAAEVPPLPMVNNFTVTYEGKTLVFGGKKEREFASNTIKNVFELNFETKDAVGSSKDSLHLLSAAERKMLAGHHHKSAEIIMSWTEYKCTGPSPRNGGMNNGAIHCTDRRSGEITNQILAFDSRCLFSLDTATWTWTQMKMLGEDFSRPVIGSTLTSISDNEIICLGGFSHANDSLDLRLKEAGTEGGYHFLVSPKLMMTSTQANLSQLPTDLRAQISHGKFASHEFEHEFDEIFFKTNFTSSEPTIEFFVQKLYKEDDSPLGFLKPSGPFVQVIYDIFDPYNSGFVHISTYNSVCGRHGLVREIVRARIRFEFADDTLGMLSSTCRRAIFLGNQQLKSGVDYFQACTSLRVWSTQFDKEHQHAQEHGTSRTSMTSNKSDWAKFEGDVLAFSPLITIELYQVILMETFHDAAGGSVKQSDMPMPEVSLLKWALETIFQSKDSVQKPGHIDLSCVRESAADFILAVCAREEEMDTEACKEIINDFKIMSENFIMGIDSRTDLNTLKKLAASLLLLSKNHGLKAYIGKQPTIVPNLLCLRDCKKLALLPQQLLDEVCDVSEDKIHAGSHSLVHVATRMYELVKEANSPICSEYYCSFKRLMVPGITPFALDTTDQYNQNQICIDFVQYVNQNTEKLHDILKDEMNSGVQERFQAGIAALRMLKRNGETLRRMSKQIDTEFLEHIKLETRKRNPDSDIKNLQSSVMDSVAVGSSRVDIDDTLEAKAALLKRISYTRQKGLNPRISSMTRTMTMTTKRQSIVTTENSSIQKMKSNADEIFADSRRMRGLMMLLLGVLDHVLEGMTSLQSGVTIQWRILKVFAYALAVASRKAPVKVSSEQSENVQGSSSDADNSTHGSARHTVVHGSGGLLMFPFSGGVTGYAVEFFSRGQGLVTLCRILSNSYKIRVLASSAGLAMAASSNSTSYVLGNDRTDAIYFTQNNHAPERYATTSVLLLLEWLIARLRHNSKMRHDIRSMARQSSDDVTPTLENYSDVAKRGSAQDTILALKVLTSCPSDACCGNGARIADLASRVLDCSLEQLKIPSKKLQSNILDHLKAVADGTAVLNRGHWESEKKDEQIESKQKQSENGKWWIDPQAAVVLSPYEDQMDEDEGEETKGSQSSDVSSPTSGSRDENCCTLQ